jgi:hypothetical protein
MAHSTHNITNRKAFLYPSSTRPPPKKKKKIFELKTTPINTSSFWQKFHFLPGVIPSVPSPSNCPELAILLMKNGFFANGNFPSWENISAFSARVCSPDTMEVNWWPEDVKFKAMTHLKTSGVVYDVTQCFLFFVIFDTPFCMFFYYQGLSIIVTKSLTPPPPRSYDNELFDGTGKLGYNKLG